MMIEKGKVYLPELDRLYVKENYSIDLLSKVFGVSMPDISRILWKYNLPQRKEAYYAATGIPREKEKYRIDNKKLVDQKTEKSSVPKMSSRSMEEDFFSSLEGGEEL